MNSRAQATVSTRGALLTLVIVVAVLKLAQDVFIPLALAILLTFLLAPLVEMMVRCYVNRALAVVASMAIGLGLIGGLGNLVFNQFSDLAHELPGYQRQLRTNIAQLGGVLRGGIADTTHAFEQLTKEIDRVTPTDPKARGVPKVQVVSPAPSALETIREVVGPVVRPLGTTLAVIVLVAFMLLRLPDLRERVLRVLGSRNLNITTVALNDAASRVSRYLLMQILINGWTGVWVTLGLWYLDVPNAVLWGALTLVLRFVPYIGVWMAGLMPLALSFAVSDDITRPLLVLGMFVVLESFSWAVLEPWLYGSHTGVSPVALLLATGFWSWLWGFAGLFLAVPMTVCAVVMGKYIPALKFLQVLLGDEPVLRPHERLYERLLSSNRDEADAFLDAALRSESLLQVSGTFIVPALLRVEEDHERGTLSDSKRQLILDHVGQWVDERMDALGAGGSPVGFASAGTHTAILCVPAADKADEVIARLLELTLQERGLNARFATPKEAVDIANAGGKTPAIVLSALPPDAVTPARAVCKYIRLGGCTAPLIVGLWDAHGELERTHQRLGSAGATRVTTSFVECASSFASSDGGIVDCVAGGSSDAVRASASPT